MYLLNELAAIPPQEREEHLANISDQVEPNFTYTRELTDGELEEERIRLEQALLRLYEMKEALKEYNKEAKAQIAVEEKTAKNALGLLKTRQVVKTDNIYLVYEDGRVLYVTPEGMVINNRPMRTGEQTTIHHMKKIM